MVTRTSPICSRLAHACLCFTILAALILPGFADDRAVSQRVDELVVKNYRKHGIQPNPPAGDEVFLRRVYLNIIGRAPTFQEAQQFLGSSSSAKRGQLIRLLLNSEGYVSHWFNYWADILRVKSRLDDGADGAGEAYADWVKEVLRTNKSYRDLVYELITAEGYVWDNGAVGYYMRDAGMPLDNMSNTAQIFLGTQLVCAQCHNHPFDRWKQKEYYELAAYTYGMETRVNPEKVVRVDEKMDKLAKRAERRERGREMNRHMRNALRDLLVPLSYRVHHDEEKMLRLPRDYQYDDAEPREEVEADTIFGKSVSGRTSKKLEGYAAWLTGPENPRFTKVIVNRLWKAVMGVGLVEPVDDFKDGTEASNPALLEYLEQRMVAVDYDMRRFLAILYNTKTFQRQATAGDVDPDDYHFPGPVLRRMSAEQVWDSLLTAKMPAVDDRKGTARYRERYAEMQARARGLEAMKKEPQKILAAAKSIAQVEYEHEENTKELRKRLAQARVSNDDRLAETLNEKMKSARQAKDAAVKRLQDDFESGFLTASTGSAPVMMEEMKSMRPDEEKVMEKGADPRWKGFDKNDVRASELPSPMPAGHFLRQFGQSDRETIEAGEDTPSVSQVLRLLNGKVYDQLVSSQSQLMKGINQLYGDDEKQDFLFVTLLTRFPTERERELMNEHLAASGDSRDGFKEIIWSLLNTQEWLFIQ